jgi:acetyl esterase/lipase
MINKFLLHFATLFIVLLLSSHVYAQNISGPEAYVYRQIDTISLKVYVFMPTGTSKDRPAILLFHGGAWQLGEAAWTFNEAKEFTKKGIVSISVDYRLANNGLTPIEGVDDACEAFKWTRDHANMLRIDPNKVAGWGMSAGGHLVACAALLPSVNGHKIVESSRPNILLLYSPALNIAKDSYFVKIMAGKGDPAKYSPSEFITNKLPPTLIIQGEKDSIVFAKDAIDFRDAAIRVGAKCILSIYPGVGHLLTRNLKVQYRDFDADPIDAADAYYKQIDFLVSLGYIRK